MADYFNLEDGTIRLSEDIAGHTPPTWEPVPREQTLIGLAIPQHLRAIELGEAREDNRIVEKQGDERDEAVLTNLERAKANKKEQLAHEASLLTGERTAEFISKAAEVDAVESVEELEDIHIRQEAARQQSIVQAIMGWFGR